MSPRAELFDTFLPRLRELPGEVSVYFKDLTDGWEWRYAADLKLVAASVIKLPLLAEAFRQFDAGEADRDERFLIRPEVKVPSCGALTYLHDGLEVTLLDLCTLMIILSDNTATNLVMDRLGIEQINNNLRRLGIMDSTLRRKMFDSVSSKKGIQNHITASDMGSLLEKMFKGRVVSKDADKEMLTILANQRLNGKIPFFLHGQGIRVAHKTGEDDGTTHDVGIVYAKRPFVVCFLSNHTDVPAFERLMQDISQEMAAEQDKEFIDAQGNSCRR